MSSSLKDGFHMHPLQVNNFLCRSTTMLTAYLFSCMKRVKENPCKYKGKPLARYLSFVIHLEKCLREVYNICKLFFNSPNFLLSNEFKIYNG